MKENRKGSANTKRSIPTTVQRRLKKTREAGTSIDAIPRDLLTEILARVASTSAIDMLSAKLSCKTLRDIAEDDYIYRHVSLENIPIVAWKLSIRQQEFLRKCEECQNSELLCRQAVVNYFGGRRLRLAVECLDRALKSKDYGALYVACIVFLFSGHDESKERGMQILGSMKKCKEFRAKLRIYRERLISILSTIWVDIEIARYHPICCTTRDDHRRKLSWPDSDEEVEVHCEACSVDHEVSLIRKYFPKF